MPVCHARKIVFVHIPRTAGTSIEKSLGICGLDNSGGNQLARDILFGFDGRRFLQHLAAKEIKKYIGKKTFDEYYKFSIVRNPFARTLSVYFNGYAKMGNFDWFVTRCIPKELKVWLCRDHARHIKPQSVFLLDHRGRVLVDFVGCQELLARGLDVVYRQTGIRCEISRDHQAKIANAEEHYNDKLKRLVELYYEKDFEIYNEVKSKFYMI
ncbi:sulfotransferase family 2 domain-containing protein [Tautonia rosea]|uniref:sulfotransferase family 2 domain-containing protein n=1 Tax=Tautonia rosea TaxID=2728037 RepID=UPI0014738AA9|nr:sulfotransferase family 2 domain-containing protein [Tautonia rosea]